MLASAQTHSRTTNHVRGGDESMFEKDESHLGSKTSSSRELGKVRLRGGRMDVNNKTPGQNRTGVDGLELRCSLR